MGPRQDPRALSRLVTLFQPPTWGSLKEVINGLLCHEALGDKETIGKVGRRSPDNPVVPRPDTRALSRPVTLFEPPMWRWLPEAINGLLGHEALGDKGDYREGYRGGPLTTMWGPGPTPGPCLGL